MKETDPTYHIIGGGLSGLACAFFAKQKQKGCRVVLYEAESRLGGKMISEMPERNNQNSMVHIVSDKDKFMSSFARADEWKKNLLFYDFKTAKTYTAGKQDLLKIATDSRDGDIAFSVKSRLKKILFSWWPKKRKFWFIGKNFNERIINVLSVYADEIKLNHKLKEITATADNATKLKFENGVVKIGNRDQVIIALDNYECHQIMNNVPLLKHRAVTDIIYQTSQTLFLPKGVSFLGLKNGIADWIYSEDNTLTAVISDLWLPPENYAETAGKIWRELDKIRKVNSAFVPSFKVLTRKDAVVSADKLTEKHKPETAETEYKNVFIAGDWTVKKEACRLESAVISARRAVITSLKHKQKE